MRDKREQAIQALTQNTQSGVWAPGHYTVADETTFILSYTLLQYKNSSKNHPGSNLAFIHMNQNLGEGAFGKVYALNALSLSSNEKPKERVVKIFYPPGKRESNNVAEANTMLGSYVGALADPGSPVVAFGAGDFPSMYSAAIMAGPWTIDDIIKNECQFARLAPHLGAKELVYGESMICLVMKKMPGEEMFKVLSQLASLNPEPKLQLTLAVLKALKTQVHDKGIIHRDISPNNIMVQLEPIEVNIIDYGLASKADDNDGSYRRGNIRFAPPEFFNYQNITQKSDIFSAGRTLAVLWTNDFSAYSNEDEQSFSCACNAADRLSIPELPIMETFFKKMLSADPADRCTVDEAIVDIESLIANLSYFVPQEDSGSSSCQRFFKSSSGRAEKGKMPAAPEDYLHQQIQPQGYQVDELNASVSGAFVPK